MLKLAALGALGYAGYKYFQKNSSRSGERNDGNREMAVAGGPISDQASVRHTPPA